MWSSIRFAIIMVELETDSLARYYVVASLPGSLWVVKKSLDH